MKRILAFILGMIVLPVLFNIIPAAEGGWTRTYSSPGNKTDVFLAVAVDGAGNVYVTGFSEISETNSDVLTIKYNNKGVRKWVRKYGAPAKGYDDGYAIATDDSGNVYITGRSDSSDTTTDLFVMKYDTNGNLIWVNKYKGPVNRDMGEKIVVDSAGSIYVCGDSYGVNGDLDYVTVKYDNNGIQKWVKRYNGPGNYHDYVRAIRADSNSVYVTGISFGDGTGRDFATIKYDQNGNEEWVRRYNGTQNKDDYANAVGVDNEGNVYVTGSAQRKLKNHSDIVIIKYGSNGGQKWVQAYNGPASSSEWPCGLAIDGYGNVAVGGSGYGIKSEDFVAIQYDSNGTLIWANMSEGPGNYDEQSNAAVVDNAGNLYVTGWCEIKWGERSNCITTKYDSTGNVIWTKSYNGKGKALNSGEAIASDGKGNVYVAGYCTGSNTGGDALLIKY